MGKRMRWPSKWTIAIHMYNSWDSWNMCETPLSYEPRVSGPLCYSSPMENNTIRRLGSAMHPCYIQGIRQQNNERILSCKHPTIRRCFAKTSILTGSLLIQSAQTGPCSVLFLSEKDPYLLSFPTWKWFSFHHQNRWSTQFDLKACNPMVNSSDGHKRVWHRCRHTGIHPDYQIE